MDAIRFGRNVRKFRERAEMTQSELAHKLGVSENYIGYIENGRKEPSLKTAVIMAEELHTTLDELVAERK